MRERLSLTLVLGVACCIVLLILVVYPLCKLVYGSFQPNFTFTNYVKVLTDMSYFAAIRNSIVVATGSTFLAVLLGTTLAWIVSRTNTPFRNVFDTLFLFPFFLSPLIGAMTWVIIAGPSSGLLRYFFGLEPNIYSLWGMIWVMGIYYSPFVFLFTSSGLKSMDPTLEEASVMSGAGVLRTAFGITLPMVTPSIISGVLFVFVGAMSMFSVPVILGRSQNIYVIATKIYDMLAMYKPDYNLAASISVFLLAFTAIGAYLQRRVTRGREYITVTGKGLRAKVIDIGIWRYVTLAICVLHLVISCVLPVCSLILASTMHYFDLSDPKFTFWNYSYILFSHPLTTRALSNSLFLAIFGATICVFFTAIVSFIIVRTKIPGRGIVDFVALVPVAIPHTAFAVALLWTWIFVPLPIYGTLWILIIAYVTLYSAYGVRASTSNLLQLDTELEECARICGASLWQTVRKVTFPLIRPGLLAAWVMLFINFLRELSVSVFLSGYGTEVFSTVLYELWHEGSYCVGSAFALIQVLVVFTALFLLQKITKIDIKKII